MPETGIIKWFNDAKGYGFIVRERGADVFVHHASIIAEGFRTLSEGDRVSFDVVEGPKGLQAKNVVKIGSIDEEEQDDSFSGESEFLAIGRFGNVLKLVALSPDGQYRFLDDLDRYHEILYICTPETLALKGVVDEFEDMINDAAATEKDFQDFFERNPEFILSDEHQEAHPHVVLDREDGSSLIPDFVLEPIGANELCDLAELKLPSAPVFVIKRGRIRFSAAVMDACAQIREYSAFFDDENNRNNFYDRYGLHAYRPRMFVIIGRKKGYDPLQIRRAQNDIPNLVLRTYDDILARIKRRVGFGKDKSG